MIYRFGRPRELFGDRERPRPYRIASRDVLIEPRLAWMLRGLPRRQRRKWLTKNHRRWSKYTPPPAVVRDPFLGSFQSSDRMVRGAW